MPALQDCGSRFAASSKAKARAMEGDATQDGPGCPARPIPWPIRVAARRTRIRRVRRRPQVHQHPTVRLQWHCCTGSAMHTLHGSARVVERCTAGPAPQRQVGYRWTHGGCCRHFVAGAPAAARPSCGGHLRTGGRPNDCTRAIIAPACVVGEVCGAWAWKITCGACFELQTVRVWPSGWWRAACLLY